MSQCKRCGQPRGQGTFFCSNLNGGVPHVYPVENLYGGVLKGQSEADSGWLEKTTPLPPKGMKISNTGHLKFGGLPVPVPAQVPDDVAKRIADTARQIELEKAEQERKEFVEACRVKASTHHIARARAMALGTFSPFTHLGQPPEQKVIPCGMKLEREIYAGATSVVHACAQLPTRILQMVSRCVMHGKEPIARPDEQIIVESCRVGIEESCYGECPLSFFIIHLPKFSTLHTGHIFSMTVRNMAPVPVSFAVDLIGLSTVSS